MQFFEKLEQKKLYILLIFVIIMIFSSLYACFFVHKEYISSTTLMLMKVEDNKNNGNIQLNDNLFETLKEIIENEEIASKVKNDLSLSNFSKRDITVKRISNSDTFQIIIKNVNSDEALAINKNIIKLITDKVEKIYSNINIYIISDTSIVDTTYGLRIIGIYIAGLILFAVISIVYIEVLINLEKNIKSLKDIEIDISLKGLAEVPLINSTSKEKRKFPELISFESEKSNVSKAFKKLRSNIQFLNVNNKGRNIILVTSSNPNDGKSYIAANIAVSFAEVGKKVILIDADMKEGRLGKIFNIPNNLGFSNYLSGLDTNGVEINKLANKFINETATKNLNLITSGTVPPNSAELLASEKLTNLIKDLTVFYDVVVIDSSSVLVSTDSLILSRIATSTILVSNYKKTTKDDLWKAKRDIQNIGGRIIGVVLNKVKLNEKEENLQNSKIKNDVKKEKVNIKDIIVIGINKTKLLFKLKLNKKSSKKLLGLPKNDLNEKNIINEKKKNNSNNNDVIIKENNKNKKENKVDSAVVVLNNSEKINQATNKENKVKVESNNSKSDNNKTNKIKDNSTNNLKFSDFVKNGSFTNKEREITAINNHENDHIDNSNDMDNVITISDEVIKENEFNIEEPIRIPKMTFTEKMSDIKKDLGIFINKSKIVLGKAWIVIKENLVKFKNSVVVIFNKICESIKKYFSSLKEDDSHIKNSNNKSDNISNINLVNNTNDIKNVEDKYELKEEIPSVIKNEKIISGQEKVADVVSNEIKYSETLNNYTLPNTNPIISNNEISNYDVNVSNKKGLIDDIELEKENEENDKDDMSELSDEGVLVIVDAENAYCRAFSKVCFTEKLVRGIDRKDGLEKAYYSSNSVNKIYRSIVDNYEITKEHLKRVDALVYKTLLDYDETIWIDRKDVSHKSEIYLRIMTKEYDRLPNETNNQYIVRCQRLRKNELIKNDLDIEYKLENIFSTNKMNITDKIIMKKYANYFEIKEKLKNKEEIEKSKANKDIYNSIVKAISKFKKNSSEVKEMTEEEKAEIERIKQEKIKAKEEKKKMAEEKKKLKKEERAEKKLLQQQEKIKKQEELRVQKEAEKEKARIEEELLGDNLYPKTKNNKNI